MRYKPSIAFDRMSGSAKGVTASSNKGAIFIRSRGTGSKKRTADQSIIKTIFRHLTQSWKTLSPSQINQWNQAAKSQSGRRVLGQRAQLTGSNLYLRLNFWVVRCGGQPLSTPPELSGVEQPSAAMAAISSSSFILRLNQPPQQPGLKLVLMATAPQTIGTITGVGRGSTFCDPINPTAEAINLMQQYQAKFGTLNQSKPKVFLRYFYVNPSTGEKSGEQLITPIFVPGTPVQYRLEVGNPDPVMGTVTNADTALYPESAVVTVRATATQNYTFRRWTDGNTSNPRVIVMDRDYSIMPEFVYDQHYRLTVTVSPSNRGSVQGTGMYSPGRTAHLVAQVNAGWQFDHWEDEPYNYNPERDVVMNSDVNLTAVFVAIRQNYDLYWNSNVYSFGSIESEVDCGTFDRGDEVELTAVPDNDDIEFVRWNDGNTQNPRTLVANRDYDLIAEFRHKTQTKVITVDAYHGQTTGSGTYHLGELIEISVTPDPGFHMVQWDDDEGGTALVRRFYLEPYTSRFFEAILESDATYHVHVECDPPQAATVTGNVDAAHYEAELEIDINLNPGWRISEWSDDRYFDGDHRNITVYEDLNLTVYLEEVHDDED